MTYLNTDIYTTTHKGNLTKIQIDDHDNNESINLDLTEKELEILYDILRYIRDNIYPRTKIYENQYIDKYNCITWDDENE